MIYLGSPYSHPDSLVMRSRYLVALQACAALIEQRQFVYSPIVHCHELASRFDMPTDFAFWRAYNFDMLRRADSFGILKIKGWAESKGLSAEIELAKTLALPTYFFDEDGHVILEESI